MVHLQIPSYPKPFRKRAQAVQFAQSDVAPHLKTLGQGSEGAPSQDEVVPYPETGRKRLEGPEPIQPEAFAFDRKPPLVDSEAILDFQGPAHLESFGQLGMGSQANEGQPPPDLETFRKNQAGETPCQEVAVHLEISRQAFQQGMALNYQMFGLERRQHPKALAAFDHKVLGMEGRGDVRKGAFQEPKSAEGDDKEGTSRNAAALEGLGPVIFMAPIAWWQACPIRSFKAHGLHEVGRLVEGAGGQRHRKGIDAEMSQRSREPRARFLTSHLQGKADRLGWIL